VVAAVCVGLGILAALLILRPPASTVAQEVEELERDFGRASATAQTAEQLA
jgi:putative intracellular protease/amidase